MIKITGEMVIRTTKTGGYYTSTSTKNEEGAEHKYDYAPILVGFRKGIMLEDKTRIQVNNAFLTHYRFKKENGEEEFRNKIVVLDYDVVEKGTNSKSEDAFIPITDDDLPF